MADCDGENPHLPKDSLAFHRVHGFEKEGVLKKVGIKFGEWFDIVFFAKQLREPTQNPSARQLYFTEQ